MTVRRLRAMRSMVIGIVVMLLFAAALQIAFNVEDEGFPGTERTLVKVSFDDVGALRPKDEVRIASVRVGQVRKIELVGGQPLVTLQLEGKRRIYRNASVEEKSAVIAERSMLGQKYITLNAGTPSAGVLGADDVISAKSTTGAQQLSDLLEVLDSPTRQAAGSTIREVGGGMRGHTQDFRDGLNSLPSMLPDLGTVSEALSVHNGADLTSVLRSADSLASRFAGRQHQISSLMGRLTTTLQAVSVDRAEPLRESLRQAPRTLRSVRSALTGLRSPLGDTESAMRALNTGAQALGQSTPDLRSVLKEAVRPLGKVPGVAGQAEPAVRDLTEVLQDARPLAPRASRALASADTLFTTLAPYSPEVAGWFTNWASALSNGDENGHWLRLHLLFSEESVLGQAGVKDPFVARNPYPEPGEAAKDRKASPLGGTR